MIKHILKTTPVSLYDIQGLERWLEERANEGLFPVRVNTEFTRFRRDEAAPGTRFRLEAANGREAPDPEQLDLYQQAGWNYLCTLSQFYFLFYTADSNALEPHTDPVTRGISLEWLARRTKRALLRARVGHLILLGMLLLGVAAVWQLERRRMALMLFDLAGFPLPFLLWFLWLWWSKEKGTRLLLNFQRSQELGISPVFKHSSANWLLLPSTIAILILLVGGRIYEQPVPLDGFSRPYLHLQELESESLSTYEELFGESPRKISGNSWGQNIVTRQFSFLSPNYYMVEQTLLSPGEIEAKTGYSPSGDPEYCYSPRLDAVYFHMLIPSLARPVAISQLAQFELVNLIWEYEEISYPGLDFAVVAQAEHYPEWQMAAVGRGGNAIALRYAGRESLADHLDVLASVLG